MKMRRKRRITQISACVLTAALLFSSGFSHLALAEGGTEPTTEQTTELTTGLQSSSKLAAEPTTEPATETTTEPPTEPATEPPTEPATEPVTGPAAEPDAAVTDVQARISELPAAEALAAMSAEERQAAYEKLEAAHQSYEALTDEQRTQVSGAEVFDGLYAFFDNAAAETEESETGETAEPTVPESQSFEGGSELLDTANMGAGITVLTEDERAAVDTVQALIDGLPTAEELAAMPLEEQQEVYAQLYEAYDAYEALSDAQKTEITGAEIFEALFAVFNDMVNALAANVSYVDENGVTQEYEGATDVTDSTTAWSSGWYVVSSSVTITDRVTVTGDVCLILVDGCTLNANSGITVSSGNSLTVYGQENGSGKVAATGTEDNAGIGGSNWTSGGTVTINGGIVEATGGRGAGIGGGNHASGGTVIINGGTVTAKNGAGGAGIGGGYGGSGGKVTINGGTVDARGGLYGAGIGGGHNGSGGTLAISGGTVTATGGASGAGIGGGQYGTGGTITIKGGKVEAVGGDSNGQYGGAGIGGGCWASGGTISIINAGTQVTAFGGANAAAIGSGYYGTNGGNITITDGTVTVTGGTKAADIGGGYTSSGGIAVSDKIEISGATVQSGDSSDVIIGPFHGPDNDKWGNNENGHWHPCQIESCNDTTHQSTAESHAYTDTVNENGQLVYGCVCGYGEKIYDCTALSISAQPALSYYDGQSINLSALKLTAVFENNGEKKRRSYLMTAPA